MPEARRNLIYELIEKKGEVTIAQLAELFPDVSSMTIRRDLDVLENENKIVKIKGGAKSISHLSRNMIKGNVEDEYVRRELLNPVAKTEIAEKATPFAEEGRSIFIDAGSTMMSLASNLLEGRFYVITSGVNVALEMSLNKHAKVNLLGGQLNRSNFCISGAGALEQIKGMNIDIAFMGASGFSEDGGFTNGDFNECELKKAVIKKAKKTIILMDSTKLGKSMPYTFCNLSDVDVLVTDTPTKKLISLAKAAGTKIV